VLLYNDLSDLCCLREHFEHKQHWKLGISTSRNLSWSLEKLMQGSLALLWKKFSYIETKNVTFDKNIYIIYISKIQMSFTVSVLLACTKQNYIQTHHFIP